MKKELTENSLEWLMQRTLKMLDQQGYSVFDALVSQCDLIMESGLDFVVDKVLFPAIDDTHQGKYPTEIRLHGQDIFVFDQWGLYLLNTKERGDMDFREHTFPDGGYLGKREAEEGGVFFNAKLSMVMNDLVAITDVSTDIFRMDIEEYDRKAIGLSKFQSLQIPVIMFGEKNIYFKLDLPRKISWTFSNTRLRLRLRGLLVRNARCIL